MMKKKMLFKILLLLVCIMTGECGMKNFFEDLFTFVPQPPINIEVTVGDSYTMKYYTIANLNKCYYETNKEISGSFPVTFDPHFVEPRDTGKVDEIITYGGRRQCKIRIRNVSKDGPTFWTIKREIISDGVARNISSKTFSITIKDKIELITKNYKDIYVATGGRFMLGYEYHDHIARCVVTTQDQPAISFDISTPDETTYELVKVDSTAVSNIVHHYGRAGLCKIRVANIDDTITNSWNIKAYDERNNELTNDNMRINFFYSYQLIGARLAKRKIYVVKGESYLVGYEPHVAIRTCYAEADTGESYAFDVEHRSPVELEDNLTEGKKHNIIYHLGRKKYCAIRVNSVSKHGPAIWRIYASNGFYNMTATTHRIQFVSPESFTFLPKVDVYNVIEGSDIEFGYEEHEVIRKCAISYRLESSTAFVVSKRPSTTKENVVDSCADGKLCFLGDLGLCQFAIKNVSMANDGPVTLSIISKANTLVVKRTIDIRVHTKESFITQPTGTDVYVPYGRPLTFGYLKHPIISGCYYETNLGKSGFYDIINKRSYKNSDDNIIQMQENCQLTIDRTGRNDAHIYTLTASDGHHNVSSKTFTVKYYDSVKLRMYGVTAMESQGFVQYLLSEEPKMSKCSLRFGQTAIDFDMNSQIITPIRDENKIARKMSLISGKTCGFKIIGLKRNEIEENIDWLLYATRDNNLIYGNIFSVEIISDRRMDVMTIKEVTIGDPIAIYCENDRMCELYNPQGSLVLSRKNGSCSHPINAIGPEETGTWKCITQQRGTPHPLREMIQVVERVPAVISTFIHDREDHVIFDCQTSRMTIMSCLMRSPQSQIYFLGTGLATERYSSLGTDLSKGHCKLRIDKPLLESEYGTWTCLMRYSSWTFDGANINLMKITDPEKSRDFQRSFKKTVSNSETLVINCQVPYKAKTCYIVSPTGVIHLDNANFFPRAGFCSLHRIGLDRTEKNGTWNCYFEHDDGIVDNIKIEVHIPDDSLKYSIVQVDENDSLRLLCQSGGTPITLCSFVSPRNKSYSLTNQSIKPLNYYGKGTDYGDCGIELRKPTEDDFGNWTCIMQIGFKSTTSLLSSKILVTKSKYNTLAQELTQSKASSDNYFSITGVAIFFLVAIAVGVVTALYIKKRRV